MAQSNENIVVQPVEKPTSIFSISKTYPAYLVLFIGLIASASIWYLVKQKIDSDRRVAFDKSVTSVMSRLENGYREHEQVLRSINGLYDGYIQVVRDVFELYASIPAKTYSSIISADYVPFVTDARKDEFIFYAQSERYVNYAIIPEGNRKIYYPIEYIVPFEKNTHRSGYDLATLPVVLKTFEQAKKRKAYTATPFFNIRPDTVGFMLTTPVFKNNSKELDGIVLLEIEADRFFKDALANSAGSDTLVAFQCYAPFEENAKERVVFTSGKSLKAGEDQTVPLHETRYFTVGDKKLRVEFDSAANAGGFFQRFLPLLSLLVSVITSFILAGLMLSMTTSRARALDLADRMTRSQRRIVDSSKDIIAVMELDGTWKTMNPASIAMLGYSPEELIGRPITEFFKNPEDISVFKEVIEKSQDEVATAMDVETVTQTGEVRWLSWNFTVSHADKLVYCVGRDVTMQKLAEEQIRLKGRQVELAENFALEASEFKSGFMIKLGHELRNSLTGIIGYLQLLSQQVFKTKEEEMDFITMAQQSSEELYETVTDMVDMAESEISQSSVQIRDTMFSQVIQSIQQDLNSSPNPVLLKISGDEVVVNADQWLLQSALSEIIKALLEGSTAKTIEIIIVPNSYEQSAEIQILAPANEHVSQMLGLLKKGKNTLLESLESDEYSVLFRLAVGASIIRRMSGTAAFEALDENDGNVVMITLPLKSTVANINI
ncbi:MAG: CHASE domain-containing protein [Bacteroidota bacterium]